MIVNLSQLEGAFVHQDGLSRPRWRVIYDWISANVPKNDLDPAWREAARQWLLRLADDLQRDYCVFDSPKIVFLSRMPDEEMFPVIRHAEGALQAIARMLPEVVVADGHGPRVILMFDMREEYITYTSHYQRDGHYATSGGCFLRDWYRHIAVCATARWHLLETVTHELAHASLSCIRLPRWLEEGVVDVITASIHPSRDIKMTGELRNRHLRYWTRQGLHEFWTGKSFHTPRGQELSYSLARVLARNLLSDHRHKFQPFLRDAKVKDLGAQALTDHFGFTLSQCAATFLGEGDWGLNPISADPLSPAHEGPQGDGNGD